jgi:hypothetical protein
MLKFSLFLCKYFMCFFSFVLIFLFIFSGIPVNHFVVSCLFYLLVLLDIFFKPTIYLWSFYFSYYFSSWNIYSFFDLISYFIYIVCFIWLSILYICCYLLYWILLLPPSYIVYQYPISILQFFTLLTSLVKPYPAKCGD